MKKAFRFILIYFILLLFGMIAGTFLYSLYLNLISFVAGTEHTMFSFDNFMKSLFFAGYCFMIFICPVLTYYRIRNFEGISPLIAYVLLALITWFLFFPLFSLIEDKFYERHQVTSEEINLSKDVFRKVSDKIYYFTGNLEKSDDENAMKGVVIDTREDKNVFFGEIPVSPTEEIVTSALPYREIEVKRTFSNGRIKILVSINSLIKYGKDSLHKGYIYYLGFLAFGFLMASIIGCSRFFKWKVMNSALLMFMTAIILAVHSFYFHPVVSNIVSGLNEKKVFTVLSGFSIEPVLFVLDVFFGLLFTVAGIIILAVKKHKNTL